MNARAMKRMVAGALAALCVVTTAGVAGADPPRAPAAQGVVVDVTDAQPGSKPRSVKLVLSLDRDRPSELETQIGTTHYHVKVLVDADAADRLRFEVRRDERGADRDRELGLSVSAALRRGTRTIIGRIERGAGESTEVGALVK